MLLQPVEFREHDSVEGGKRLLRKFKSAKAVVRVGDGKGGLAEIHPAEGRAACLNVSPKAHLRNLYLHSHKARS